MTETTPSKLLLLLLLLAQVIGHRHTYSQLTHSSQILKIKFSSISEQVLSWMSNHLGRRGRQ